MAMQAGMGLSKIILFAGAGALLVKHGNFADLLGEIQVLRNAALDRIWLIKGLSETGGLELSRNQLEGDSDYSDAIAAQVRRLAMDVRQLASSGQLTALNSGESAPAATIGALGYGYLWWKGIALSDFVYVTKYSFENAVTSFKQNLGKVTDALAAITVKANLDELGHALDALQSLVSGSVSGS